MKCYLYKGTEYRNEREVRYAIFQIERKIFGECKAEEDWAKHGVTVAEKEVVLTEEELAKQLRAKRDALLSKTDYFVMQDYPSREDDLEEVLAYRKALRDLPTLDGFPVRVAFPTPPAVIAKVIYEQ